LGQPRRDLVTIAVLGARLHRFLAALSIVYVKAVKTTEPF